MAGGLRDCQPAWPGAELSLGRAMSKADQQREERLAAALRDNLKRRKAQSRESEPDKPSPQAD